MTYCRKCGTLNSDQARFCKGCGQKLDQVIQQGKMEAVRNTQPYQTITSETEEKNTQPLNVKKIFAVFGIAGMIAVVCSIAWFIFTLPPQIDLKDFVEVSISGTSPMGYTSASINWDKVESEYGSELEFTDEARSNYGLDLLYAEPIDYLRSLVTVELDKTEDVANGDEVTYTVSIDDAVNDIVKVRLSGGEGSMTMDGLDTYASTLDEISDSDLEKFKMAAEINFSDNKGISGSGTSTVESFDYIGSELFSLKDASVNPGNNAYNQLYMVYKVIVHNTASSIWNDDTYDGYTTYYWYGCFENVTLNSDGECTTDFNSYMAMPSDRFREGNVNFYWNFTGYQSIDELNAAIKHGSYYNMESDVDANAGSETKNTSTVIEETTTENTSSDSNGVIGEATVKVNKLRIRSKAATSSEKVGYVKKGKSYDVYETKTAGGYTWYRIGEDQWIANDGSWITYEAK